MEEGEIDGGDSVSSSASEVSVGVGACESDSMEEFTSSASSSPPSQDQLAPPATALHDMSSLFQHLPFKWVSLFSDSSLIYKINMRKNRTMVVNVWIFRRGLSKYYQGKSESFTSLSNVRCLEDLAKPENPYNKKLKTSRSYGGGLSEKIDDTHKSSPPKRLHPRLISKKASRGRCSQMNLNAKSRVNFLLGSWPPISIPPHTSPVKPLCLLENSFTLSSCLCGFFFFNWCVGPKNPFIKGS